MCGISGIVGPGAESGAVRKMVAALHHRGPDENGVYHDPDSPVVLGHNRLRIIDLSSAGRQPMSSADGTCWLSFNGEIYNYLELRDELKGYPFRTVSDTEVLLAAWQKWGPACVDRFVGMFSFALWDRRNRQLFCARDRAGVKPFLYGFHQGRFYFASEAKALFAAGFPVAADEHSWATYLVHSYTDHSERTFFEGVRALPPGHSLTLADGEAKLRCYWNLPALTAEIDPITESDAIERFDALFTEALRLRLRSDVKLGVNLTGGIDSSALMVTADRLLADQGQIETFTAAYGDPRYDEQEFASEVPHRTEWKRNVYPMGADAAWSLIPEAVWHQEAPFGAVATLGYHHLLKQAKAAGVTVLLEGQGVDEMIAGYEYFRVPFYRDLLEAGDLDTLRSEAAAAGESFDGAVKKAQAFGAHAGPIVYQDGTSHLRIDCVDPRLRGIERPVFGQPYRDHLRSALYRDFRHTKLPRVLRMNDRLSMASSRELRVVYLDHRVAEFLFRLPATLRIKRDHRKYLLRKAMEGRLPDSVRLTPKRAVVTPQREWFQNQMRSKIEDIISSRSFKERGLFDADEVRRTFARFCAGEDANAFFVWQWVNTELWYRRFIDSKEQLA